MRASGKHNGWFPVRDMFITMHVGKIVLDGKSAPDTLNEVLCVIGRRLAMTNNKRHLRECICPECMAALDAPSGPSRPVHAEVVGTLSDPDLCRDLFARPPEDCADSEASVADTPITVVVPPTQTASGADDLDGHNICFGYCMFCGLHALDCICKD